MTTENIVPLFKHRKKNIKVVGGSNRTYPFINHQYFTANKAEIAELTKLAEEGGNGIYIDPAEPSIDTNAATPMAKLEKNLRDKLLAELAAEGRLIDPSSSDQSRSTAAITSTADSVINGNSAAERAEAERKEEEAKARAAANPALANLEALKNASKQS